MQKAMETDQAVIKDVAQGEDAAVNVEYVDNKEDGVIDADFKEVKEDSQEDIFKDTPLA
jgi:hypothetical protein